MSSVAVRENNFNLSIIIKKIFDEIDEVILKSNKAANNKTVTDDNNYNAALDQSDKSNVNLVEKPNVDAEIVICPVDGIVKNEGDENENIYCVTDILRRETMISDSSDDESSPKKSKQFTFPDSNLPDSNEIKEFLKSYPPPLEQHTACTVELEPFCIKSESKSDSEDENDWLSRRRRNKKKLVEKVTIEKLPARFMTRQRVPNIMLSDEVSKKNCVRQLQSIYLKKQDDEMDADIIHENIKRLKTIKKHNVHKRKINVNTERPVKKGSKSKSIALKNTKKSTRDSILAIKRKPGVTESKKKKIDVKMIKNKCVSSGVRKPDYKRRPIHKKDESILPAFQGRRSRRHENAKVKQEDSMKAPELLQATIPKKGMHEQSTDYNISSSDSEPPKSLKRSLIEDSDVPSPKCTRSYSNVTNASVPTRSITKAKKLQQKKRGKRKLAQQRTKSLKKLNSNRNFLNVKTRSQSARSRSQHACRRTSERARTSKHLQI